MTYDSAYRIQRVDYTRRGAAQGSGWVLARDRVDDGCPTCYLTLVKPWGLTAIGSIGATVVFGVACGTIEPEVFRPLPYPSNDAVPPVQTGERERRLPQAPPPSIEFRDTDPTVGVVDGDVRMEAVNGSDVSYFDLFWASDDATRLGARIASLPTAGMAVVFRLRSKVPFGATKLLVVSRNEKGESPTSTSTWLDDSVRTPISIGPINSGNSPAVVLDPLRAKLVIVTSYDGLHVFRCNLDGTACTYNAVSAPEPLDGAPPSVVIDEQGAKLILAAMRTGSSSGLVLYHCGLDGTACVMTTLPVPASNNSHARLVIDKANAKLVVAADVAAGLGFWRCELDGTACGYQEAPLPTTPSLGQTTLSLAFNATNGKVVVAVGGGLVVCNADTTGCAQSSYPGITGLRDPAVACDSLGRIFVVGSLYGKVAAPETWRPTLVRCDADGTSCVTTDIGAGKPLLPVQAPSLVIDESEQKLMVAVADSQRPAVLRCQLDGTGCSYSRLSMKEGCGRPAAFLHPTLRQLGVVVSDRDTYRPSLLTVGPWP